jgi:hypothetical protein
MTAHRFPNGNDDGCELARKAMVRATDALDASRNVYESIGGMTREQAAMRAEMRAGFAHIDQRMRDTARKANEAFRSANKFEEQELENLRKSAQFWKRWVLGILAGIIVAVVGSAIVRALIHH